MNKKNIIILSCILVVGIGIYVYSNMNFEDVIEGEDYLNLSSGYIRRALKKMPKQGSRSPWKNTQNYLHDITEVRWGSIKNKDLTFKTANK